MKKLKVMVLPTGYINTPKRGKNKGKTSRTGLSMNWYRNAHYQEKNKVKKYIKSLVEGMNISLPNGLLHFHYTLYANNKSRIDVSNWCSVCSKFFLDALAELGHIEDDNVKYIPEEYFTFGGVDTGNGRIEIRLVEKAKFTFI